MRAGRAALLLVYFSSDRILRPVDQCACPGLVPAANADGAADMGAPEAGGAPPFPKHVHQGHPAGGGKGGKREQGARPNGLGCTTLAHRQLNWF